MTSLAERERHARWRAKNKDYTKKYRDKDREAYRAREREYGQRPEVKERKNAASRKWYAANKDHRKQYEAIRKAQPGYTKKLRDISLRKYGLSSEEKLAMMAAQDNRCFIQPCGHEFKDISDAQVDHCHTSGRVRKLLCGRCNRALGLVQDDPERLRFLAAYIEAHAP